MGPMPSAGTQKDPASGGSSQSQGRGAHRLADAIAAVEELPALSESRGRIARLVSKPGASVDEISEAVESDAGLAIAVLRAAGSNGRPRRLTGIPEAIEVLSPGGVAAAAASVGTYELFESAGPWEDQPERFRRHALATRHAAERIADLGRLPAADELALAALLHDVGRLVLLRLYPGYSDLLAAGKTPEDRVAA